MAPPPFLLQRLFFGFFGVFPTKPSSFPSGHLLTPFLQKTDHFFFFPPLNTGAAVFFLQYRFPTNLQTRDGDFPSLPFLRGTGFPGFPFFSPPPPFLLRMKGTSLSPPPRILTAAQVWLYPFPDAFLGGVA